MAVCLGFVSISSVPYAMLSKIVPNCQICTYQEAILNALEVRVPCDSRGAKFRAILEVRSSVRFSRCEVPCDSRGAKFRAILEVHILAWGILRLMRAYWIGLTLFFGSLALSQTTSPADLPPISNPKPTPSVPKPTTPKPVPQPVAPPVATVSLENSKTVQTIRARGRLIVALDPQFAPFALRDEKGKIVGFDVDLAKTIAAQIGVPLEAQTTVFGGLLNAVKVGRADFAGSGLTPTSRKDVQYSEPFFDNAQIFVVRAGNPTKFVFQSPNQPIADLSGKQIGVRANTIGFLAAFQRLVPLGAKINVFDSNQKALAALQNGKIESLILDAPSFAVYRGRRIPIDKVSGVLVQERYVFVLPKDSDLPPIINQAIVTWRQSGGYFKALEKWMLDR